MHSLGYQAGEQGRRRVDRGNLVSLYHWFGTGVLLLCLLGGCLGRGPVPVVHYYSLAMLPLPALPAIRSWPVTLGVRPFTATPPYKERMLYRLSAVEVGFADYERWVAPPENMVTQTLMLLLRHTGLFQEVITADDAQPTAWILSGALLRFDEVRSPGDRHAECWVQLEVRQAVDARLLWSGLIQTTVPLATAEPASLAQAMSQAVQQVGLRFLEALAKSPLTRPE